MHKLTLFGFVMVVYAVSVNALDQTQPKPATAYTKKVNAQYLNKLPFDDAQDFVDAKRGFVATVPNLIIKQDDGLVNLDLSVYEFLNSKEIPDTINPSLWRQAQLNYNYGLYKVTEHIYQIRGYDLSNMTIIQGNTGIIIIDPLITKEAAKAALELYYANLPKQPVIAVIYTHSHVDHFGGVKGVTSQDAVDSGNVQIIAPEGFLEEAISENVYAGNAMGRRAQYQYGMLLPKNSQGQVDVGLGKTLSIGETTLIAPTVSITQSGQKLTIDGVEMEFLMAPETEAPAEMLIYFPQFKALCTAEDVTHTLHNLYTLRGAQVRNANKWWKTINEAIKVYGEKTDVIFAQHHWPKWGKENIVPYMQKQRDQYKYIHDQSLNLLNNGYTMTEVAEMIQVPDSLTLEWYNRGYYGSINHDAKAIYQRYLGWYDSNPANLHPYPPVEAAKRYVEFMGGEKQLITNARRFYDKGDYRWVAEVMKHVVFANPDNKEARYLQADAFEQLGYQQENPTWRSEYLSGAYELRNGTFKNGIVVASPDLIAAMTPEMILDFMGLCLNGPKASAKVSTFNMIFAGNPQQPIAVSLENGVLVYTNNEQFTKPDVTVSWSVPDVAKIIYGKASIDDLIKTGKISVTGNKDKLQQLFSLLDKFDPEFNIVTP